jgi:lysophospholipase L1-like esterase
MTRPIAALAALTSLTAMAWAADPQVCAIPGHFLQANNELKQVARTVASERKLTIAVVGTASSALAGPDGPRSAYPARLEAALQKRMPDLAVKVVTLIRRGEIAEDLAQGMAKLLVDETPDLVIWQTGTIDAMRRVEVDSFRAALEAGIETLHKGGADVILMNMQYSPRTETMVALDPYADNMRVVAQHHEIPVFDRLGIMRHWSDAGTFDLYAAGKANVLAQRVHDCIGRAMASLIIEAAHLQSVESKSGQQ